MNAQLESTDATEFVLVMEQLEKQGWARLSAPPEIYEALQRLVAAATRFFEQPLNDKLLFDIRSSVGHRGYVPVTEQGAYADEGRRRYEAFDIGREPQPTDVATHRLRGSNVWPSDPDFGVAAAEGFAAMERFSIRLGHAICDYLGIERAEFDSLRTEPISQLRLIRYLAPDVVDVRDEPAAAMGAHTDYEFFTLLYQSGPGSQVLDRSGSWVEPSLAPDSLIMFCGDLLEVFSGGRLLSTLHRASGDVAPGRISIPFFCGADFDAKVRPQTGRDLQPVLFGNHLMRQLLRDFPYLRKIGADPERAGEQLIELTKAYTPPQLSRFEKRRLVVEHDLGAPTG